jgi:hypothetical protein
MLWVRFGYAATSIRGRRICADKKFGMGLGRLLTMVDSVRKPLEAQRCSLMGVSYVQRQEDYLSRYL